MNRGRFARTLLSVGILALLAVPCAPAARGDEALREEVAVISTQYGEIVFRFFIDEAPIHSAYVKELIGRGFYDGTAFHRVIPHFVIQGGDPNSRDADRSNDGEGEADRRLKAEFSESLHYRPGTVGMAREADPDSGSCQFFIALENIPRLDARYTVFGEVISGLEVARRIAELPRDLADNPLDRVVMTVALKQGKVPDTYVSLRQEESGEVLTGPGKPRPWDPGSVRWTAPALAHQDGRPLGTEAWPAVPLDLCVGHDGSVLDVRFVHPGTPNAAEIQQAVKSWRFVPARSDGKPVASRFWMDSHGGGPGPSAAPGTPLQPSDGIVPPAPSVPVALPPGVKRPPEDSRLRLVVDEEGRVAEAAVELSCGDAGLDEAALAVARGMVFVPALREGKPVTVYLSLPVKFLEAPSP